MDWMEEIATREGWNSGQMGGPSTLEIAALARVFPAWYARVATRPWEVRELKSFINLNFKKFQLFAFETSERSKLGGEIKAKRQAGYQPVDIQHVCHRYSGGTDRAKLTFVETDSGRRIELLSWVAEKTYAFRAVEMDRLREAQAP